MSNHNGAKGGGFLSQISDNSATMHFPAPRGLEKKLVSPRELALQLFRTYVSVYVLTMTILHSYRHASRQHRRRLGAPRWHDPP